MVISMKDNLQLSCVALFFIDYRIEKRDQTMEMKKKVIFNKGVNVNMAILDVIKLIFFVFRSWLKR